MIHPTNNLKHEEANLYESLPFLERIMEGNMIMKDIWKG